MRYAVIDCGSNTIRLGIYAYKNQTLTSLYNEAVFANLAGYIQENRLTEPGIQAAIRAVEQHKKTAQGFGTAPVLFATAAIRNAKNTEEICEKIKSATGISADVLTGEEEAMYSFYGAVSDFPCENGVMADVGGGSSEIILFEKRVPVAMHSVPLGSLKAFRTYVKGSIPQKKEANAICTAVLSALCDKPEFAAASAKNLCIVGGGVGASLALAKTYTNESALSVASMEKILARLMEEGENALPVLQTCAPKREHTITPALAIYTAVGAHFGADKVYVSHNGIKEGYILKKLCNL